MAEAHQRDADARVGAQFIAPSEGVMNHAPTATSPFTPRRPSHDECQRHAPGTFLDAKHFGLLFRYLVAKGRHGLAYELLYKAKVFDDYVYVFHGEHDSPAAAFLRKELPKFFVRGLYRPGSALYPCERASIPTQV